MPKRRFAIEIFAPTLGLRYDAPADLLDPRASPNGLNNRLIYGCNQKEYGTSLYATGSGANLGAPANFIFEAKFPSSNLLQVLTHTAVHKYSSGTDAFTSDGQTFTGTFTDFWSGVMHNDAFIYSNGIDAIQYKPTVASTGTAMQSALSPTTYKAWALASLREHLCLYHTVEDGAEYFKRVRWTNKGLLTYSAGTTDFDSGTAGFVDVQDMEGEIKLAVPLGAGMAVYAERSIHQQLWVGGDEIFQFHKSVQGVGTPSRRGVVGHQNINYVFGHDTIYEYYGGDDIRDIGGPIKKELYTILNDSNKNLVFLEYDDQEEELFVYIPTDTDYVDACFVYRAPDKAWSKLGRTYSAAGKSSRKTGTTIGELQGNIGGQTFTFGEASIRVESSVRLYSDQSGNILKHDKTRYSITDSGTQVPQTFIYETPDLTAHTAEDPYNKNRKDFTSVEARWQQYSVVLEGTCNAHVLYSTNRGQTFTELSGSPVTAAVTGTQHILDVEVMAPLIRFRLTNTTTEGHWCVGYQKVEGIVRAEDKGDT